MIIAWIALAVAVAALAISVLAVLWTLRPPTKRQDTRHRLETELIDRAAIDQEMRRQGITPGAKHVPDGARHGMVQDVVSRLLHN